MGWLVHRGRAGRAAGRLDPLGIETPHHRLRLDPADTQADMPGNPALRMSRPLESIAPPGQGAAQAGRQGPRPPAANDHLPQWPPPAGAPPPPPPEPAPARPPPPPSSSPR